MEEKFIKIDTHTHSNGISFCSRLTVEEIIDIKKSRGYDGIILTNHCQGHYYPAEEHASYIERVIEEFYRAKAYGEKQGFLVMLGLEVTVVDPAYNDWLLYGVTEEFLRQTPCLYQMSQRSLFELCEKFGVVLVQAHPFRNSGWGDPKYMHGAEINCSLSDIARADEVLAQAKERGLLVTCGTDFHFIEHTYNGGMKIPARIRTSVDFANYLKSSKFTEIFLEERKVEAPTMRKYKDCGRVKSELKSGLKGRVKRQEGKMKTGKRLGCVALALGMLASSALGGCSFMGNQEESKDVAIKKFKLLMIGNSYSDDTAWLLPNIASNFAFEEMEIGVLYIGGCSLGKHYENSKTGAAGYNFRYFQDGHWIETYGDELKNLEFGITFKDWDFITMQQSSMQSGAALSYGTALTGLISYVQEKATNPDMKLVWNMTWAYANDYEPMQTIGYPDQATMYELITGAVQRAIVPNENFAAISPTGTAIQNARTALGDKLNRDGTHLTLDVGRYIAAATMFCTIADCTVDKISFIPDSVDEETVQIAKESVKNALKNKFEVTQSAKTGKK